MKYILIIAIMILSAYGAFAQDSVKIYLALINGGIQSVYSTDRIGHHRIPKYDNKEPLDSFLCRCLSPKGIAWKYQDERTIVLNKESKDWGNPCIIKKETQKKPVIYKHRPRKKRRQGTFVILPPPDNMLNTKLNLGDLKR